MAKVVVAGYMLRYPLAGNVLAYFHYVLGLARLGHDVTYVEESGWPYSCYDPESARWGQYPAAGIATVRALFVRHDLAVPLIYVDREGGRDFGGSRRELARELREADLLLNLGGVCWLPEFLLCPRRALVDMDPLFTQAGEFGAKLSSDYTVHTTLFSYGSNIGKEGCTIPTLGLDWLPTVPPVVPEMWAGAGSPASMRFTTVANWSAYGPLEHEGHLYGQKDEEFLRLVDMPSRTSARLEIALSGAPDDVAAQFEAAGWVVRSGGEISRTVNTYLPYVTGSAGEFSAAKHAYVKTRSGWFSDRSVCYLAAGRPVVLQDTGFSRTLPTGEGLLAFSTADEAAAAVEAVVGRYASHSRAATDLAATLFDYRVVLPSLLERALRGRAGAGQTGPRGGGSQ